MTLRTRDQAELADANVAFHLNQGVDFVIATDHKSEDGTVDILESYQRAGYLHLIRESGDQVRGSAWRTRMARLAATEYGADWVFNADGDEFWFSRSGMLKDVLEAVPERFGVVWGLSHHFVPRPDDGDFFAERMIVRATPSAPINDPTSPYRPHAKLAHRSDPSIVIDRGNHRVGGSSLLPLHGWHPFEVFHFPFRSLEQYEHKGLQWWRAFGPTALAQYVRVHLAHEEGRIGDAYQQLVVDDAAVARGVADGCLTIDTRLRDALRSLRVEHANGGANRSTTGRFLLPELGRRLLPPQPPVGFEEKTALDLEALALREADVVRLHRRLDELIARLATLEQGS